MKRFILGILALMLIIGFSGCDDNKNLDGLISHFKENKIDGSFQTKSFAIIGAINGGGLHNNDTKMSIEIYEFKDSDSIHKMLPYKNGRFGLLIHSPKKSTKLYKKIIDTFEDY